MQYKWQSSGLYEHPAKHNAGTYGKIVLHDKGEVRDDTKNMG
jgi:hypothetical protein